MNKTEKAIYELLKKGVLFRDEKGIYTIFPQKLLIQASGKGESSVRRILKSLEEQGYIIRKLYREVNLMKFYFLKEEDLTGLKIIDRSENEPSPLENCHPLPLENDDSYTFRVGEIPPEENGIIVQKSFHPHIERS